MECVSEDCKFETLCAEGSKVDVLNKHAESPLHLAIRMMHDDVAQLLVNCGTVCSLLYACLALFALIFSSAAVTAKFQDVGVVMNVVRTIYRRLETATHSHPLSSPAV